MSEIYVEQAVVISQEKLSSDVYSLMIKTQDIAKDSKPGQFVALYCKDGSRLLPRPISICEIDKQDDAIRLVYRVLGEGTKEFSTLNVADTIKVMGPLGNGYTMEEKDALLVAGGIGIPPILELAKQLKQTYEDKININIVVGYRDELFLNEELEKYGKVYIAMDNGMVGTKGTVMDAIKENNVKGEIIYSCGPMPMLKAIKEYAASNNIKAQISLEERMACGVGACLGCVVDTKEKDHHSNVNNARICMDGPVFLAEEVDI